MGNKHKGDEDMEAIKMERTNSIPIDLQEKLNKIAVNTPLLTGKKNMIELNPNNQQHKEWYEEDKYNGR